MNDQPNILLLGIGNILWADEGFGVRVIERIAQEYQFPDEHVRVLDGGTQGLYLVDQVRWADILVIFDAIDFGLEPGTLRSVRDQDVPSCMQARKMSLHQTSFQEVLGLAQLLGDGPQHMFLAGVQPVELDDYGGSLRPAVKDRIEPAIALAREYLESFGVEWQPRQEGTGAVVNADTPNPALAMDIYEAQRPDAETACRIGDERVLAQRSTD